MKLIINCNKIRTEKAIQLFSDIVSLIEKKEIDGFVNCEVKEK